MSDSQSNPPNEPLNSEDLERASRLFAKLAAEEPPIETTEDTAAGKTAPRQAIITGHTRPVQTIQTDRTGQYIITLALGVALMMTLVVTVLVFLQGGGEDEIPEAIIPTATISPTATPTIISTTDVATPLPAPINTLPPTEVVAQPTLPVEQFIVDLPPTAAVDERGIWLLTPVAPVNPAPEGRVIRQDDAFTSAGAASRLEVLPYTIQSGDTLTGISDRFGLDVCSIVWANPRNKVSPLRVGAVIDIIPVDGVLFKIERKMSLQQIAELTQVDVFSIIDSPYNDLFGATPESVLVEGMKVVVPDGVGGDCNIWAAATSGGSSGSGGVSGGGGGGGSLWGCSYGVENGAFAGNTPVSGNYTFFQGFSAAHSGVDLAASTGTPVVAAGSGAVAFAGWNEYGYGNAIVIDHGGIYTLYGHLSAINVGCGQQVTAGSVIGAVGSTGRSSGPHLHFEIRDAGFNPVDPTYSVRL